MAASMRREVSGPTAGAAGVPGAAAGAAASAGAPAGTGVAAARRSHSRRYNRPERSASRRR